MATAKTTKMDAQGRVILPPHIRKALNLNPGQLVNVSLEGGTIKIQPAGERCCLCGETVEGKEHTIFKTGPQEKHICRNCAHGVILATKV